MSFPLKYLSFLTLCITIQLGVFTAVSQAIGIPPAPALQGVGFFTQDYAAVFIDETQDFEAIGHLQEEAFVDHYTPIIIVTLETMKPYGYHPDDFETLSTNWFNQWQIGTQNINGKKQGILILLVKQERKCRIELGADWQNNFDAHCQDIMQYSMVPYFRSGDYANGLHQGVRRILDMVKTGPNNPPPSAWSINPAIVMFGLIGVAIVVMSIVLAWREPEKSAGFVIHLMKFFLLIAIGLGVAIIPKIFFPIFIFVVIPGSLLYKLYRAAKGLNSAPQGPSLSEKWQTLKNNITSWSYWKEGILNFFRNLGKSDGYTFGDRSGGGWGGGGGFSGGGGGFSGGGFSGGSSGGGGATGSW